MSKYRPTGGLRAVRVAPIRRNVHQRVRHIGAPERHIRMMLVSRVNGGVGGLACTPTVAETTTQAAGTHARQASKLRQRMWRMPIAWIPPSDMDQAAWQSAGHGLGEMGRVSNWWIGDWLRYGTAKFGEKYTVAARITGYDRHTLENMVYVASRYEFSLRRENLTWSHHFLVAALPPEEREGWLNFAAERRLSVNDLRIEVKAAQRAAASDEDDAPAFTTQAADGVVCPQCGYKLPPGLAPLTQTPHGTGGDAT
jgi:hypothetical protein